jgi:hypothetical protein
VALKPEDMDFISNFSTLWAVVLGAVLATLGGFVATQMEWFLEQRRRERNAALFFGEVLSTLNILLDFAANATKIGDPFGPITLRLFRSVLGEVEIYNRNRETLYDLKNVALRTRIHTLVLRVNMAIDGIVDTTNTISALQREIDAGSTPEERGKLESRMAALTQTRQGSYEFVIESAGQIKGVVKALEPIAHFSAADIEQAVRNA